MKDYIIENYKRFHEYVGKNALGLIKNAGSIINFVYANYLKNNSRDGSLILGNVSSENSCLEEITSEFNRTNIKKKVVQLRKRRADKQEVHKELGIEIGDTGKTFLISYK